MLVINSILKILSCTTPKQAQDPQQSLEFSDKQMKLNKTI